MSPSHMASYYMTLLAHDQDPAGSTLQKTFQVRVDEKDFGALNLGCSIARIKDEVTTKKPFIPHFHGGAVADELPDWPSDDDFSDGKRFYVLKESEWQATDWISMYLELVVCTHALSMVKLPRAQADEIMSKLEILKVAIETSIEDVEPSNESLNAKSANVYIIYKGLSELRVFELAFEIGEHIERKAIVRRVIHEDTGNLTLVVVDTTYKALILLKLVRVSMTTEKTISSEEYNRARKAYWRVVKETEGFDLEDTSIPNYMAGMIKGLMVFDCQVLSHWPFPSLVKLYAKVGLHRYNISEGTSFVYDDLIKFNATPNCVASYYITLLASDPSVSPEQPKVPKDEVTTKKSYIPHFHGGAVADGIFKGELPDWPLNDDFSDEKRFYVVKTSELQEVDWVLMYLELVICAHDRFTSISDLLELEIVKVVIESNKDGLGPDWKLGRKNANVYINYKDKSRADVNAERKAMVRRVIDEGTQYLSLAGKLCGGPKEEQRYRVLIRERYEKHYGKAETSSEKRPRLG
ncbi:unnamed protein product [Thlaspi arvense]|uniref:Uncharacterized protein n=1 Tax=Thlaspi arvense TaxID=13288 RepID=A0AAU9R7Y4_THLAR|nr:unnamed protein product [Thlaspi arvense]